MIKKITGPLQSFFFRESSMRRNLTIFSKQNNNQINTYYLCKPCGKRWNSVYHKYFIFFGFKKVERMVYFFFREKGMRAYLIFFQYHALRLYNITAVTVFLKNLRKEVVGIYYTTPFLV